MKRETATFSFSEKYRDKRSYRQQDATVSLKINYEARTYSIIPMGSCNNSFSFIEASHQWEMWKAVLKAIDSAIDFANQEVGNTTKVESK